MELPFSFLFGLGGGFSIFTIALAICFWWLHDIWNHEIDREWWAEGLEVNAGRTRYRRLLERRLNAFSAFLCGRQRRFQSLARNNSRFVPPPDMHAPEKDPAWSWALLDFSFFLAMVYPCLIMLGLWVATGEPSIISGASALPERDWPARLILGAVVFQAVLLILLAEWRPQSMFFGKIFLATALGSVAFGLLPLDEAGRIIPAALAAVCYTIGGLAGASLVSTVVGMSLPIGYALLAAHGFTASEENSLAETAMSQLFFLGPLVLSLMLIHSPLGMLHRRWCLLGFQAILLTVTILSLTAPTPVGIVGNSAVFTLAILCGLLPILNGWADFLSLGLTRYLLRAGTHSWTLFFSIADVILGLASFMALGFAMIGTVALIIHWNGPEILNLGRLLNPLHPKGLLLSPEQYWWLWLSLLTTLIPTLLHACVATFSLIAM